VSCGCGSPRAVSAMSCGKLTPAWSEPRTLPQNRGFTSMTSTRPLWRFSRRSMLRDPAPVEHGHELGHQAEHSVMCHELDGAGRPKTVGRLGQPSLDRVGQHLPVFAEHAAIHVPAGDLVLHDAVEARLGWSRKCASNSSGVRNRLMPTPLPPRRGFSSTGNRIAPIVAMKDRSAVQRRVSGCGRSLCSSRHASCHLSYAVSKLTTEGTGVDRNGRAGDSNARRRIAPESMAMQTSASTRRQRRRCDR